MRKFEVYLMYPWLKFEFKHHPNVQKFYICTHTKKIDVTSGMAILKGPVPLKTGVVPFCTLPSYLKYRSSRRWAVHSSLTCMVFGVPHFKAGIFPQESLMCI
jgi:hypothetical protein